MTLSRRDFVKGSLALAGATAVFNVGCAKESAAESKTEEGTKKMNEKCIVIYFSWGGNTRKVAHQIADATGADLFEIEPATSYTRLRYGKGGVDGIEEVAAREVRSGYQPPLKAMPPNLGDYGIVFVGSPNWFNTIAPPVATFMATAKLDGKIVAPFMTHGGSRMGRALADMGRLAPGVRLTEPLPVPERRVDDAKAVIKEWLGRIK